jgi:hypothetical protein
MSATVVENDSTLASISKSYQELNSDASRVVTKVLRQGRRSFSLRVTNIKAALAKRQDGGSEEERALLENFKTSWCSPKVIWELYRHWQGRDIFSGKQMPLSALRIVVLDPRRPSGPSNVVFLLENLQYSYNKTTTLNLTKPVLSDDEIAHLRKHAETFGTEDATKMSSTFLGLCESGFQPAFLNSLRKRKVLKERLLTSSSSVLAGKKPSMVDELDKMIGSESVEEEEEEEEEEAPSTSDDEFIDDSDKRDFNRHIQPDSDDEETMSAESDDGGSSGEESEVKMIVVDEEDEDRFHREKAASPKKRKQRHHSASPKKRKKASRLDLGSALLATFKEHLSSSHLIIDLAEARKVTRRELLDDTDPSETVRNLVKISTLLSSMREK